MNKEQAAKLPRYKNPLGHLPEYTKDPKNYETIQKALLDSTFCGTTHSDPAQMFECLGCQTKALERRELMKKFGFRNAGEYLEWKKIHTEIKTRYPLVDWENGRH